MHLKPYPRIHHQVEQIRQKGSRQHQHRGEKIDGQNNGVVPGQDGLIGHAPHARPGENGFDDDGSADESRQNQSEHGDEGEQRIPEGMFVVDLVRREPLGLGRSNIVLPLHLQHLAPHISGEDGDAPRGAQNRGDQKMPDAVHEEIGPGRVSHAVGFHADDRHVKDGHHQDDQNVGEEESGDRYEKIGKERGTAVVNAATVNGGPDPHGKGEGPGE